MSIVKTDPSIRQSAHPELDRIMISPEGVPLNVTVAPFMSRVWALLLDLLIIFLLSILIGAICLFFAYLFLTGSSGADMFNLDGQLGLFGIIWIISNFVLQNGYFIYFEMGDRAATWGKRALGIRVASRDGGRLTAEAIIARNILRTIELFIPLQLLQTGAEILAEASITQGTAVIWVLIFALFPLFNKDRLRCGDLIAGTWVIQNISRNLGSVVAPTVGVHAGDVETAKDASGLNLHRDIRKYEFSDKDLSVYGEYELQTLESVLRTGTDEALETVTDSISNKIGRNPDIGDERIFLESYYTALRAKLEGCMRLGKRRKDKFSKDI
ncbi:RDD family protein [Parasphingorhabdus sp. JC815]|uniref:RDD family protein n=1 Tax=Parasphingorhabdus sp. JC815 TaxID=3232140 RepID=UPI003457ECDA